ncbi:MULTISPECIES: hypothetical protein [Neisseria]|uniref:hypothetical protein n=1 Tax=Neisseria TaxID=482 RepID=UPI00051DE5CE|nr:MULTISPECIES: hypothetical protein [Neisseria]KGJ31139.1 hypothetical protein ES17_08725 [Neisseria mucosa]OHQ28556.1 hypothetical protein HMPREF2551_02555 [Neisseria sp. HMSC066H01]
MNRKLLLGLLCIVFSIDISAKTRNVPVSQSNMQLKELLLIFSDTKQPEVGTEADRYHIKGMKWQYGNLKKEKNMYNSSRIKVKTLKDSEVIIHGRDGYINSIDLSSSYPNKQFKKILEANLGKGVVKELVGCRSEFIPTEKAYQISFKNRAVIYVNADANFDSEPFMSPLYTLFQFSLTRPSHWKC